MHPTSERLPPESLWHCIYGVTALRHLALPGCGFALPVPGIYSTIPTYRLSEISKKLTVPPNHKDRLA